MAVCRCAVLLLAAVACASAADLVSDDDKIQLVIASGKPFSVACPTEATCPPPPPACPGPSVEADGSGGCVPKIAACAGRGVRVADNGQCEPSLALCTGGDVQVVGTACVPTTSLCDGDDVLERAGECTTRIPLCEGTDLMEEEIEGAVECRPVKALCEGPNVEIKDGVCQPAQLSNFIGLSSPAGYPKGSALVTARSNDEEQVDRVLYLSGDNLKPFFNPVLANTMKCTFVDPLDRRLETWGQVVMIKETYVVRCDLPEFPHTADYTVSLDYVAVDPPISIPFKGRVGNNHVTTLLSWATAVRDATPGISVTINGNGFVIGKDVACTAVIGGQAATLTGKAISAAVARCAGDVPAAAMPDTGSATIPVTITKVVMDSIEAGFTGSPAAQTVLHDVCKDGMKNYGEEHIDCGGTSACLPCEGTPCTMDSECSNGAVCTADSICQFKRASCLELLHTRQSLGLPVTDGVYELKDPQGAYDAYCDMTTDGGGWTLVSNMFQTGRGVLPSAMWPAFRNNDRMWTKGGDGLLSAPLKTSYNADDDGNRVFASQDWRRILTDTGKRYNIRIRVWRYQNNNALEDVYYSFNYPGFVTQDDGNRNAGDDYAQYAWRLEDPTYIVDGKDRARSTEGGVFWFMLPAAATNNNGLSMMSGCGGWAPGEGTGECKNNDYRGSAGFLRQGSWKHGKDPPGITYAPHAPAFPTANNLIWGPHNSATNTLNSEAQAHYFLREAV